MIKIRLFKTIRAKPISYDNLHKRKLDDINYIVIHYTGNSNDTATSNANYFKNFNTRQAGAHFFISRDGTIVRTIPITRSAWSVGGVKLNNEGGKYYLKCTNQNSISIEFCDILEKDLSQEQIESAIKLIKYIRSKCKNITHIIRHYDVTGKLCPVRYIDNDKWVELRKQLT